MTMQEVPDQVDFQRTRSEGEGDAGARRQPKLNTGARKLQDCCQEDKGSE